MRQISPMKQTGKTEEVQFNLLVTFTPQFNTTDHWLYVYIF